MAPEGAGCRRAAVHSRSFPARPDQVREARRFLAGILDGCPAADDAILVLSELASNAVLHSESRERSGTFTVTANVCKGQYVRIEAHDDGGRWNQCASNGDRPHGLDIIAILATASGVSAHPLTGRIAWATLDWQGRSTRARTCDDTPSRSNAAGADGLGEQP